MKNQKLLIISILAAAVLISGSIFYYTINLKKINNPNNQNQTASVLDARNVDVTGENFLGSKDAPVTIVEYSSYFCSHCISFYETTFPQLKKNYIDTGKVKFILRSLPAELAQATFCAGEQNKYWEFSDYLFEHTQELTDNVKTVDDVLPSTKKIAKGLGLDENKFSDCYTAGKYLDKVQQWSDDAQIAKVEGTPTFFINTETIVGEQPYETFKVTIDKFLNN